MKVLWVGNIILPQIAEHENSEKPVVGGWMVYLADLLSAMPNISLIYAFDDIHARSGDVGTFSYVALSKKKNRGYKLCKYYINQVEKLLRNEQPDVIHIWGTENEHALAVVEAAKKQKMINRVVVSIQGMVSVYAKDYCAFLPDEVIYGRRLKDFLKGNVKDQQRDYTQKGKIEVEAIKGIQHVIGRTDWDKANVWSINPNAKYYFNNEILRKEFYSGIWNYDECEKHSIFCSQAHYPIKGIHLMLEALVIIKRFFPDARLYIGGKDFSRSAKWKLNAYQSYVLDLINRNNFEGSVQFTGFLDGERMKLRYLKSNVFVSPSSIENSPNSVGEAMILGVPVVSSRVGGVHNMLRHGEEGYLYPADEVAMLAYYVCQVFKLEKNAEQIGMHAKERATKTHSVNHNLSELMTIYKEISEEKNK